MAHGTWSSPRALDTRLTGRAAAIALACLALATARADWVEVRVAGLADGPRENVMAALDLAHPSSELSAARIRELHAAAEDQIRRALEPFGYYAPAIRATLDGDDGRWLATYVVDPGRPLPVDEVHIRLRGQGADDPGLLELERDFPLAPGDTLVHGSYEAGKAALVEYAAQHGYLDAEFTTAEIRVDLARYAADIVLHYETGPQYDFGRVVLRQDVLKPRLLERFITFERGEPLDLDELRRLQGALGATGWFSRVEVRTRPDQTEGREVPVLIDLQPARPQRWRIGAGYGTDTGARASVGLDLRRLNRSGHHAETDLLVSQIEQSFSTKYAIPGPRPMTDEWSVSAGWRNFETDTSEGETALTGGALTRTRGTWRETFAATWQRETFEVGDDAGTSNLFIPDVGWSRIQAEDRIFPLRGRRIQLRGRGAAEGLISNASFAQVSAGVKWVRSLGRDLRGHARIDTGYTATNDFRDLPPSIRFFAGGDNSVRGYKYQSLGAEDGSGNVIGGEVLATASVEVDWMFLEFEKAGRWGLAAFHDWGDAAESVSALEPARGPGVGLRWVSPIGLVRADVAWGLDLPGSPARLHVWIGPDL